MKQTAFFIMSVAAILIALSAVAPAEPKYPVTVHGIGFTTGVEFSAPQKAGLNALLLVYPKNSSPGKEGMSIMAVLYDREQKKELDKAKIDLIEYTRSTFMGSVVAGTAIKKKFGPRAARGERFAKKIPRPVTAEVYLVPLKNGSSVALGFQWQADMKADAAERIIAEAAATFRE
ncbi:MAG: hypothetical protein KA369_03825 [Spirochaetes bacterium]|nr:hypothetical protein [Spirochaetota bacterium]